jgi:hypothetical protein
LQGTPKKRVLQVFSEAVGGGDKGFGVWNNLFLIPVKVKVQRLSMIYTKSQFQNGNTNTPQNAGGSVSLFLNHRGNANARRFQHFVSYCCPSNVRSFSIKSGMPITQGEGQTV